MRGATSGADAILFAMHRQPGDLIATKLFVPQARPGRLPRPQLLARLAHGGQARLILLCAAAGAGKTSLAASWLQQQREQGWVVGWLSLDTQDSDPAHFWRGIIAALELPDPATRALSALLQPPLPEGTALAAALINALADAEQRRLLVLDDYHLLASAEIHAGVGMLVERAPPWFQLVITSRAEPPLPLARLRARGELTVIGDAELRFTPEEAQALASAVLGRPLTPEELALLMARTEGWAAGLQLIALALRDHPATQLLELARGEMRLVADYLVSEVLDSQPPLMQHVLQVTAISDRLCAELCAALLATAPGGGWPAEASPAEAQAMLERLERAHLFLAPLDTHRHWYRYHPLFAELLRARLRRSNPDLIAALHECAAQWFAAAGLEEEAIIHALAGQSGALAVELIDRAAPRLVRSGRIGTLQAWVQALPEPFGADPRMQVARAWIALYRGGFGVIDQALDAAEAAMARPDADIALTRAAALRDELVALRAIVAIERGQLDAPIAPARRTLATLAAGPDPRSLVGALAGALGIGARAAGEAAEAAELLALALERAEREEWVFGRLIAGYELGEVAREQGHLDQAAAIHQRSLAWCEERFGADPPTPLAGAPYLGLGAVWYEQNELAAARQAIVRGIGVLVRQPGGFGLLRDGYGRLALIALAEQQLDEAESWLAQAESLARQAPRPSALAPLIPARVQLWRARQDAAGAAWAARQPWGAADGLPAPDEEPVVLAWIGQLLARPEPALLRQAAEHLHALRQRATAQQRCLRAIELGVAEALIQQALGQPAAARASLDQSLALAAPRGVRRTLLDWGDPLADLLSQRVRVGPTDDPSRRIAEQLLAALRPYVPGHPSVQPAQQLIEPLSVRELEVLQLLATGLANAEIAAQLIVAEGTIKKHTHNIFGKLGARNRTEALLRARELGLLP